MSFDNSKVIATKGYLIGSADAIRRKLGTSNTITLPNFESAIDSIPSGGGEPYIPKKQLISEFDFKSSTPYYDIVKDYTLATNMRGLSNTQGVGITATARGNRLRTGTNFDYAGIYEMEIKFGTFDRTTALSSNHNMILKIGANSTKLMLSYYYNSNTDTGKWWVHDQSGNNIYLDAIENQPYYFENKTLTVTYGCKYVNGELVRDAKNGYFYVDGVQLNSTGAGLTGDDNNQIQIVFLCDSGNNAFVGAVYESLKIYQYNYELEDIDLYIPSQIKIVEELPSTLVNDAVYLIPNGDQVYPDINTVVTVPNPSPSLTNMKHVTVTCNYTPVSGDRITIDKLNTVTKFWLLDGEGVMPKTRGSYPDDITYGSANRQTPPSIIYEYDTEHPELGWVDISSEVTQADWEAGTLPSHILNTVVFSNVDISRNTIGISVYSAELYNLCNVYGKISQIGAVTTYDVYNVYNGSAISQGTKTIPEVFELLADRTIEPTPVSLLTASLQKSESTDGEETKEDDVTKDEKSIEETEVVEEEEQTDER